MTKTERIKDPLAWVKEKAVEAQKKSRTAYLEYCATSFMA